MRLNLEPGSRLKNTRLSIAMAAHDTRKKEVEHLLTKYKDFFETEVFEIICTATTKTVIEGILKTNLRCVPSGRLGGDEVIASLIV